MTPRGRQRSECALSRPNRQSWASATANHNAMHTNHRRSSPNGLIAHPNRALSGAGLRLATIISTPNMAGIVATFRPSFVILNRYCRQSIPVRSARMAATHHRALDSSTKDTAIVIREPAPSARSSAFRPRSTRCGVLAPWRCPSQRFAAPGRRKGLTVQGRQRGQDKGRQCAKPMRPGRGLDSQGFWALLRNVCGNPALCGAGRTPVAAKVFRTVRSAAP